MSEVIFTGKIPICPRCKRPTVRGDKGGAITLVYYPPVYDLRGNNMNPDRNRYTWSLHCRGCNEDYAIVGNKIDGYKYLIQTP